LYQGTSPPDISCPQHALSTGVPTLKGGHAIFVVIPQIANPQILGAQSAIANSQISEICASLQIRKFVMINPQIRKSQKYIVSNAEGPQI
jgi:hypothetical protein